MVLIQPRPALCPTTCERSRSTSAASASRIVRNPAIRFPRWPTTRSRFSTRSGFRARQSSGIRSAASSPGAAIAHPDRVTALALIGTGLSGSNAVTRELQSSLRDLPDPIPVQFARDFQASTAFRPIPPDFFERIIEESLKLPPRLWRLAIDRLIECDDAKELSRIEAPTQLLWGDKDALFSRTEQQSSSMLPTHAHPSMRRPGTARIGSSRNASRPTSWRSRRKLDQLADFARAVSSPAS